MSEKQSWKLCFHNVLVALIKIKLVCTRFQCRSSTNTLTVKVKATKYVCFFCLIEKNAEET